MKISTLLYFLTFILTLAFATGSKAQNTGNTRYYRVTAVKKNDNTVVSQSNIVEVAPQLSLYIPNSFTPNNDGLNDNFGAFGEGIKKFHLEIYNSWGELVFESFDINDRWNGQFKGQLSPSDVYLYKLSAEGIIENYSYQSGTVTLLL